MTDQSTVAVLGAGPAGLMAAWELNQAGFQVILIEASCQVGGMAGTIKYQGRQGDYRFDFGGHRFITRNPKLLNFVESLMADELLHSQRKSVIRFQDRTYRYPLALGDLLRNAPLSLLAGAGRDLLRQLPGRISVPQGDDASFAEWIESRFGSTLYQHFFAGYTAKLWGIDPRQLSAEWAAQRISLLNLKDVAQRLLPQTGNSPRTYARNFRYPKLGFGRMFDRLAEKLVDDGVELLLNCPVTGLHRQGQRINAVQCGQRQVPVDQLISTLPLPMMAEFLQLPHQLQYRSLRFFNMPMATENISDNTWQYLSDPHILATRLQEPRRRSPFMAPPGQSSLMLEIPCFKNDDTWRRSDNELLPRVIRDLESLGVDTGVSTGEYFSSYTEHAYPLMRVGYQRHRQAVIEQLNRYHNLVMTGRQGTFRYIFTDTAMEMGQIAARSLIEGRDRRHEIYNFRNEPTVIETQSVA